MKLKVNNVHKFYGTNEARIEVLKGINCEVLDGEICVLLGPSGSGKSTLLNIIGGLESADEGCIDIGDFCTANMKERELSSYRRNNLGFVFQFYNLIPNLTVKENIEVCAHLTKNPLDLLSSKRSLKYLSDVFSFLFLILVFFRFIFLDISFLFFSSSFFSI